jgi:hypothetical protein
VGWHKKGHERRPVALCSPLAAELRIIVAAEVAKMSSGNPDFDEEWYMNAYPDVAAQVVAGRWAAGAREHYEARGRREGRLPCNPKDDGQRVLGGVPQKIMPQSEIRRLLSLITPRSSTVTKTRVGRLHDGGYVINNDFDGLEGVVSIGIGDDVSFDEYFAGSGLRVYQYDPTVDGPVPNHPNFVFRKVGWARGNSLGTRDLAGILRENGLEKARDLLLKFDVEHAEWDALSATASETLAQFRIIVGEFHGISNLYKKQDFDFMHRTFSLFSQTHVVTHLHANNYAPLTVVQGIPLPWLIEISFLRRDRATFSPYRDSIPSSIDYPCHPLLPDLVLTPFT